MKTFIGRKNELKKLEDLNQSNRANLVVINGRRRIGKSRLAEEFAKNKVFLSFTGLAPIDHVNDQDQRDAFARQFASHFKLPPLTFSNWSDAFSHLSLHLTPSPTVILFDEISWMGTKDPTFLPKLKVWWDLELQKYPNVTLVLCGSVSTWIEENIIQSTAFFGRISLHLTLGDLSLPESYQFLKKEGFNQSTYDTFKVFSITGGVPWYLEQINSFQSVDENIKRLCFDKNGLLVREFDLIFHDLFSRRGTIYKKIVHLLSEGMRDLLQIRTALDYPPSGSLSDHLKALIISGFVTQHYTWSIKTGNLGRQSLYRLSDNYLRFYLKYIEPNLPKINKNSYQELSLRGLPGWDAMMDFQVETLLLSNRHLILKALNIHPQDIVADNPYLQRKTNRLKGCQIDYLIQTHTNNLFICEFKFSRREINLDIIESVQNKIKRFSVPRGFGISPVLLHFGGVTDAIHNQKYFYRIIDIADFLEKQKDF